MCPELENESTRSAGPTSSRSQGRTQAAARAAVNEFDRLSRFCKCAAYGPYFSLFCFLRHSNYAASLREKKGGKKAQVISCDKSVGLLGKLLSYSGDLGLLRPLDAHRRLEEGGRSRREVGEEEPVRGDLLPSPYAKQDRKGLHPKSRLIGRTRRTRGSPTACERKGRG